MGTSVFRMETPTEVQKGVALSAKKALKVAGVSQREAAAKTGIPLTTLTRKLGGHTPLNINEIAAIAQVTGFTVLQVTAGDIPEADQMKATA